MIRLAAFLGLIGLFIATGIIAWTGFDQVMAALAQAGWVGIFTTSFFHIIRCLPVFWGGRF